MCLAPSLSTFKKRVVAILTITTLMPLTVLMSCSKSRFVRRIKPLWYADLLCRDEELKEKVKRCVIQGHIDPEDFNGVGLVALHSVCCRS